MTFSISQIQGLPAEVMEVQIQEERKSSRKGGRLARMHQGIKAEVGTSQRNRLLGPSACDDKLHP